MESKRTTLRQTFTVSPEEAVGMFITWIQQGASVSYNLQTKKMIVTIKNLN